MDLRERTAERTGRHPWEVVRAEFFTRLLADHDRLRATRWLDVGAGDAWLSHQLLGRLPPAATVTAWDINYGPNDVGEFDGTGGRIVLASERPRTRYDRILLLDVIEHVEDDDAFLAGVVADLLEPDGSILISVPAYQSLFSAHDTALGHYRRYTPAQLRAVAGRAGLRVVAQGSLFTTLLGARAMTKARERIISKPRPWTGVGGWTGGPALTRTIVAALGADARASRVLGRFGLRLPGLSCWVLCTRTP